MEKTNGKEKKKWFGKGWLIYTGIFLTLFLMTYGYLMLAGILGVPDFIYTAF